MGSKVQLRFVYNEATKEKACNIRCCSSEKGSQRSVSLRTKDGTSHIPAFHPPPYPHSLVPSGIGAAILSYTHPSPHLTNPQPTATHCLPPICCSSRTHLPYTEPSLSHGPIPHTASGRHHAAATAAASAQPPSGAAPEAAAAAAATSGPRRDAPTSAALVRCLASLTHVAAAHGLPALAQALNGGMAAVVAGSSSVVHPGDAALPFPLPPGQAVPSLDAALQSICAEVGRAVGRG